jgi:uncharacterized protein YbjQ (UPF0145 family)
MNIEMSECPNCGAKLKNGLLSSIGISPSVTLIEKKLTDVINLYHDKKVDGYCTKCVGDLDTKYLSQLQKEREHLQNEIQRLIEAIPVVSTHSPLNWDYDILCMVTGQSTTGTGVVSEFTSSFADLFGAQSGGFNKKLKAGEDMCFTQLRKQVLDFGGNAVIATDIDYSEVGGEKGMLMVCMGGTAIRLKNVSILGADRAIKIDELAKLNQRIKFLFSIIDSEQIKAILNDLRNKKA